MSSTKDTEAAAQCTTPRKLVVKRKKALNKRKNQYVSMIKPIIAQLDNISKMVAKLEASACHLDSYSKHLQDRLKDKEH